MTPRTNSSLSALGNVIIRLHAGSAHVPYRDSKLTHLLQARALGRGGGECVWGGNGRRRQKEGVGGGALWALFGLRAGR